MSIIYFLLHQPQTRPVVIIADIKKAIAAPDMPDAGHSKCGFFSLTATPHSGENVTAHAKHSTQKVMAAVKSNEGI